MIADLVGRVFDDKCIEEVLVKVLEDLVIFDTKDILVLFLSKTFFLENKFEEFHTSKSNICLFNKDINIIVKIIHGNCFKYEVNVIKLEYVHKFQNLIRLLGLFDYAINLKV